MQPNRKPPAVDAHPAGSVRQQRPTRPAGLQGVPVADLAAELLHRLLAAAAPSALGEADVRLGLLLARELETRLDVHQNRTSRTRYRDLFENFHRSLAPERPPLDGATWVDLGCGAVSPWGALFLFIALGARRGIAIDPDVVQDAAESSRALADLAALLLVDPSGVVADHPIERAQLLRNLEGFDLARLRAGDPAGLAAGRLDHRRESVHALSLGDGEADVVMTNAFLEHIDRVDAALAELARITRRGGFGIHVVDGRDHRSIEERSFHPLEFLREPAGDGLRHGCNRLRPLEFARAFERHGFRVVQAVAFERIAIDAATVASFAEPFRSLPQEVLAVTQAKLVVRRN